MHSVDFPCDSPPSLFLVISGSSGAGKDAVIERMKQLRLPIAHVVTATTRQQRQNEIDGIHYHFLGVDRFLQMVEQGEMLEWARVYERYYGVPRFAVADALKTGRDVVVKVDVQGAATIRRTVPGAILVFIKSPSIDELERRLRGRQSESPEEIAARLSKALHEYEQLPLFDYVLTNHAGRLDEVVDQVRAIMTAERLRVNPPRVQLGD